MSENAQQRIQRLLAGKRGADIMTAVATELAALDSKIEILRADIRSFALLSEFLQLRKTRSALEDQTPGVSYLRASALQYFLPKNGFHEVEYSAAGIPYRWTGPEAVFSFDYFLDRFATLNLGIRIISFVDAEAQLPLLVRVDGVPVASELVKDPNNHFTLHAVIPAREKNVPLPTHISCALKSTLSPTNSDSRLLGLAFSEIVVTPRGENKSEDQTELKGGTSTAS